MSCRFGSIAQAMSCLTNIRRCALPSLLEDAIRQLEAKHGVTLQVSAFAGLLGQSSHQPSLWRPVMYLGRRSIENAD